MKPQIYIHADTARKLHRRLQKAEGALARERAKYDRLCEIIRDKGMCRIGGLRPLIEALSSALCASGITYSSRADSISNRVVLQILDSVRTLNAALYSDRNMLLCYTSVKKK